MTDSPAPKQITGKTKIMFILGDPVAHIRGTALFNEHFSRNGIDAASSPLQVAPADLGTIVGAIRKLRNVVGFGVTLPHKIEVLQASRCHDRAGGTGGCGEFRAPFGGWSAHG